MLIKCKDVAHQATHYLEANQPWYRKVFWYLHLSLCSNCRRFVKQLQLTIETAKRLSVHHQADEETVERVVEKTIQSSPRTSHKNGSPKQENE